VETETKQSEPRDEAEPALAGETPAAKAPEAKTAEKASRMPLSAQFDDLVATVRRLEAFAGDEAKRVSDKLVPQVELKARQNIWVSLLFALGLGLILGLWLNGGRRRE
jgi:hypothetical protein